MPGNVVKFILALDAKMADMPRLEKTLVSLAKVLNRLDPGLKMTKAGLYGVGFAAGQAIKGFTALGTAARSGASAAMRAVHDLGRAIDPLAKKGGPMGFLLGQVGGFFKDAASSFLGFASFEGLKALATGAVNASMEMVKLASVAGETDRILSQIAGPRDAKRIQALSDAIAKASGIDSDAFNSMAAGLLRAGMPLAKLENAFAMAADITGLTPGLKDKSERTAKAMEVGSNLVRMQQKGGFDKKMLKDVGIDEQSFFKDIGRRMGGMSAAEVEQRLGMGAEGGISASKVFAAADRALKKIRKGGAPGAIGDEMGKSPGVQLERVIGAKEDLFKSLAGGEGIAKMGEALGRIADMLDPNSPTGKSISTGLNDMLVKMAAVFKSIDVKTFSDTLVKLFSTLPPLIMGTVKALEAMATVVGKLFPSAGMTPQTGSDVAGIADWKKNNPGKQGISDFFRSMFGPSDEKLRQLYGDMGRAMPEGAAQGIAAGSPLVSGSLFNMIDDAKQTVAGPQGIDAHSPSKVFERYGRMTGEGFAVGVAGTGDKIAAATLRALPAPSQDIGRGRAAGAGSSAGVTVSAPITINYTGQGGEAAAQEIADMIKDLLPGQLQSVFTRLSLEAGTA